MISLPADVEDWLRSVFARCNEAATRKISTIPNVKEEMLDLSVIEALSQVSAPVQFESGWLVHLETHFLGASPLWRNWEIADIGILVVFRSGGRMVRTKVALLQSKRLYPKEVKPESPEERRDRYYHGFAGLLAEDETFLNLTNGRRYHFSGESAYKAIKKSDDQYTAIEEYQAESKVPVYYLLYNPAVLPLTAHVPIERSPVLHPCELGSRVVPAKHLHKAIGAFQKDESPSWQDLATGLDAPFDTPQFRSGWRLEYFVVDLLLRCRTGRITDVRSDEGLNRVFYRRTGAIAAAISLTIDAPPGHDWAVSELGPLQ